jgi:hypothetical protein
MGFQRLGPLRIGNYILGETLGVGSFGKVKRMLSSILDLLFKVIRALVCTVLSNIIIQEYLYKNVIISFQ